MNESTKITNELDQTNTRLNELIEMRYELVASVDALQQGFIAGTRSLDDVQTEQSRLSTLEGSIRMLEGNRNKIQSALNKCLAIETRQDLLEKTKSTALEAESTLNEYLKIIADFNELVGEYGAKMLDTVSLYHTKRRQFQELFAQTGVTLEELGLTSERHGKITVEYINYPPTEYGEILHTAQKFVQNKREREERDKRRSARA